MTKNEKLINQIKDRNAKAITQTAASILKEKIIKAISEKKLQISRNLFGK